MVKKSLIVLFRYFLILPNRTETKQNKTTEIPKFTKIVLFGLDLSWPKYLCWTYTLRYKYKGRVRCFTLT